MMWTNFVHGWADDADSVDSIAGEMGRRRMISDGEWRMAMAAFL